MLQSNSSVWCPIRTEVHDLTGLANEGYIDVTLGKTDRVVRQFPRYALTVENIHYNQEIFDSGLTLSLYTLNEHVIPGVSRSIVKYTFEDAKINELGYSWDQSSNRVLERIKYISNNSAREIIDRSEVVRNGYIQLEDGVYKLTFPKNYFVTEFSFVKKNIYSQVTNFDSTTSIVKGVETYEYSISGIGPVPPSTGMFNVQLGIKYACTDVVDGFGEFSIDLSTSIFTLNSNSTWRIN
jgi:hypothetical protein